MLARFACAAALAVAAARPPRAPAASDLRVPGRRCEICCTYLHVRLHVHLEVQVHVVCTCKVGVAYRPSLAEAAPVAMVGGLGALQAKLKMLEGLVQEIGSDKLGTASRTEPLLAT